MLLLLPLLVALGMAAGVLALELVIQNSVQVKLINMEQSLPSLVRLQQELDSLSPVGMDKHNPFLRLAISYHECAHLSMPSDSPLLGKPDYFLGGIHKEHVGGLVLYVLNGTAGEGGNEFLEGLASASLESPRFARITLEASLPNLAVGIHRAALRYFALPRLAPRFPLVVMDSRPQLVRFSIISSPLRNGEEWFRSVLDWLRSALAEFTNVRLELHAVRDCDVKCESVLAQAMDEQRNVTERVRERVLPSPRQPQQAEEEEEHVLDIVIMMVAQTREPRTFQDSNLLFALVAAQANEMDLGMQDYLLQQCLLAMFAIPPSPSSPVLGLAASVRLAAWRNPLLFHLLDTMKRINLLEKAISFKGENTALARAKLEIKRAAVFWGMCNAKLAKKYALASRQSVLAAESMPSLDVSSVQGDSASKSSLVSDSGRFVVSVLLVAGMLGMIYDAKVSQDRRHQQQQYMAGGSTGAKTTPNKVFMTPTKKKG